jgi:hypothetical protein
MFYYLIVLPESILPANRMMPFRVSNMPSTAIPSILNGRVSSQIKVYKTKAIMAIGQQRIKRMIHIMNVE